MSSSNQRHNHIGEKMFRERFVPVTAQSSYSCEEVSTVVDTYPQSEPNKVLLSKTIYALIRYLNFKYDEATRLGDLELAQACMDRKARLLLQLLLMEQVESK